MNSPGPASHRTPAVPCICGAASAPVRVTQGFQGGIVYGCIAECGFDPGLPPVARASVAASDWSLAVAAAREAMEGEQRARAGEARHVLRQSEQAVDPLVMWAAEATEALAALDPDRRFTRGAVLAQAVASVRIWQALTAEDSDGPQRPSAPIPGAPEHPPR